MTVNLDIFELHYLLESCLRGSHLRSTTILKYVDDWYELLSPSERQRLYDWTLRLEYNGEFKPRSAACGADRIFMARYNPDNQYRVTVSDGVNTETVEAFKLDGRYWIKSNRVCAEEYIKNVEKINGCFHNGNNHE